MSEQELPPIEQRSEREIADTIKGLHQKFLDLVPQYSNQAWDPRAALKERKGSCMAELLYVAGGLLANGVVKEQDVTIGFAKDHGEEQPTGFVGKSGKKYAHTFMLITLGNGVTLETDFRANRADEEPRLQRLLPGELEVDDLYLGTIASAVTEYARVEGVAGPTVSELMGLHLGLLANTRADDGQSGITGEVTFDEDF
jgi:hypothetical protein